MAQSLQAVVEYTKVAESHRTLSSDKPKASKHPSKVQPKFEKNMFEMHDMSEIISIRSDKGWNKEVFTAWNMHKGIMWSLFLQTDRTSVGVLCQTPPAPEGNICSSAVPC